jgi:hypothetical protein
MPDLLHRYSAFLRARLGAPARKISIDAGFTCPNRDGRAGRGGCAWCRPEAFAPGTARRGLSITEQIARCRPRRKGSGPEAPRLLAYFQPYTNTDAPPERLVALWEEALAAPGVAGLVVGTRPDCVPDEVLECLEDFASRIYVQLELGLQTANDATLRRMNRGHAAAAFDDAMRRAVGRGIVCSAHMIAGLPGETREDALRTVDRIAAAGAETIKIHAFHLLEGTALAAEHARRPLPLLDLDSYAALAADCLERLPWRVAVERVAASAPAEHLVGPAWCSDPAAGRRAVEAELRRRGSRQGACASVLS